MKDITTKAWRQYEAGKEYKRRIGLYETICKNERFYRGDQWQSGESAELPHPVFNIIKRVTDYMISSICSSEISLHFSDENLPFTTDEKEKEILQNGLALLDASAAYRWE